MKSLKRLFLFCLIFSPLWLPCAERIKETSVLRIYGASSLKELLEECGDLYFQKTGVRVEYNFASSSVLARQIDAGADCDLFVSADREWMDYLDKKGLVRAPYRKDWLSNKLVLIAPVSLDVTGKSLKEKLGFSEEKIIMGDPDHVPAGKYSMAALTDLGLWEMLKKRIVPAESTRAALRVVETGAVDRGVVFMTDAIHSVNVKILEEIPYQGRILYPVGVTGKTELSSEFFSFLFSEEVLKAVRKHGFIPLQESK